MKQGQRALLVGPAHENLFSLHMPIIPILEMSLLFFF